MRSANAYVSSQYNGPGVKIARVTVMMLNHSPGEVVNLMMKMKREAHDASGSLSLEIAGELTQVVSLPPIMEHPAGVGCG